MINFSFAITVCNEANELKRLLTQLKKCVVADDEVVIQVDQNNTTEEVLKVVSDFEGVYSSSNSRSKKIITPVTKLFVELKGDFSGFKNNLKNYLSYLIKIVLLFLYLPLFIKFLLVFNERYRLGAIRIKNL